MRYIQLFIIVFLSFSCSTKKFIYFQEDKKVVSDSSFYTLKPTLYSIQPGDILYITVHSSLSETENMFHFPGQGNVNTIATGTSPNMYLTQFVVSDSGQIRLPVIGHVYVVGSTVQEVEEVIEIEAKKYIEDAIARVKLVSYRITFLGEFGTIGEQTFYKDRVHILDALAKAGEVTYYGDRENLRVMRQTDKGIYSYRIDLTDKAVMTDEKFFLHPNDIVYAEPLPRKVARVRLADYGLILATITSTIAFAALLVSLNR